MSFPFQTTYGESQKTKIKNRRKRYGNDARHHNSDIPVSMEEDTPPQMDILAKITMTQNMIDSVNEVKTPPENLKRKSIPRKAKEATPDRSGLVSNLRMSSRVKQQNGGILETYAGRPTSRGNIVSSGGSSGQSRNRPPAQAAQRQQKKSQARPAARKSRASNTRFTAPSSSSSGGDDSVEVSTTPFASASDNNKAEVQVLEQQAVEKMMNPRPKHTSRATHKNSESSSLQNDSKFSINDLLLKPSSSFFPENSSPELEGTPSDAVPDSALSPGQFQAIQESCFQSVPEHDRSFGSGRKKKGSLNLSKKNNPKVRKPGGTRILPGASFQSNVLHNDPIEDDSSQEAKGGWRQRDNRRKSTGSLGNTGVDPGPFHRKPAESNDDGEFFADTGSFMNTPREMSNYKSEGSKGWMTTKKKKEQVKKDNRKRRRSFDSYEEDNAWRLEDTPSRSSTRSRTSSKEDTEWQPRDTPKDSRIRRPSTRSQTKKHKQQQPRTIDLCSDSEPEEVVNTASVVSSPPRRSPRLAPFEINVVRIAFGKKVVASNCRVVYQEGKADKNELTLLYQKKAMKKKENLEYTIHVPEEIEEMKYHLVGDETANNADSSFDESEQMTLMSLRITPNKENKFQFLSNKYAQSLLGDVDSTTKYAVVEFRSNKDLLKLLERFRRTPQLVAYACEDSRIKASAIPEFAASLLEESKNEKKRRESCIGSPRKRRGKGRKEETNELLLVFPFGESEEKIDSAAEGLVVAHGTSQLAARFGGKLADDKAGPVAKMPQSSSDSDDAVDAGNNEDRKGRGRTHLLTIHKEDRERLTEGEFLNDTLIDFWMQWMWRKEKNLSNGDSDIHIFTSHFYTTLKEKGPSGVTSWTAKKGIDVFTKKFIFIPINKSLHWSLCVVVNPGAIMHAWQEQDTSVASPDTLLSCILFFDSLKAHSKLAVANAVRKWLNAEWLRLGMDDAIQEEPFKKKSMPVFDPMVPYQNNSWDCGVFVCRYAYGMYCLREEDFTLGDSQQNAPFYSAITESEAFRFDMEDIALFREELGVLIDRLSTAYLPWKKAQDDEEKKAKADRKRGSKQDLEAEQVSEEAKCSPVGHNEFTQEKADNNGGATPVSEELPSLPEGGVDCCEEEVAV